MLTFDGTASARAAASVRGVCYLIEADFLSGLLRVTTHSDNVVSGGNTYLRQGNALTVGGVTESENTDTSELAFSLSVADSSKLALAVGDASEYRGRAIRLYFQLLDEVSNPAGAAVKRWSGYMTHTKIERAKPSGADKKGGGGGTVKLFASRAGLSRLRRNEGLRMTHAQQLQRFPGDNGYEYVTTLIEKPVRWLSKRFQEI